MIEIEKAAWAPVPAEPVRILIDTTHTDEYPFCADLFCPCHGEDGQILLGELLASGRVNDRDAGDVYYGEKPVRAA